MMEIYNEKVRDLLNPAEKVLLVLIDSDRVASN